MTGNAKLEKFFVENGLKQYRWVNPQEMFVEPWVRMKCRFGCGGFGKFANCPPNAPGVDECRNFFHGYQRGVAFHFPMQFSDGVDDDKWATEVNLALVGAEREAFLEGYYKAFAIFVSPTCLCAQCTGERTRCIRPREARPTLEGMSVNVYDTMRQWGYPIDPVQKRTDPINRYAMLLVE